MVPDRPGVTLNPMDARYRLHLANLYSDVMNIYGDRGNVLALRYRCERRGIELESLVQARS